jgi:hypothetical protein
MCMKSRTKIEGCRLNFLQPGATNTTLTWIGIPGRCSNCQIEIGFRNQERRARRREGDPYVSEDEDEGFSEDERRHQILSQADYA